MAKFDNTDINKGLNHLPASLCNFLQYKESKNFSIKLIIPNNPPYKNDFVINPNPTRPTKYRKIIPISSLIPIPTRPTK